MREPAGPPLLFVTTGFPPDQVGGIEQHTLEVARALRDRGVDVAFYARGGVHNSNLDSGIRPFELTEREAAGLVAFLEALSRQ